jgi:hypothetical protein
MSVKLGMTMIDYLLLGGLFAAIAYTVYRLFVGWRHSSGVTEKGR